MLQTEITAPDFILKNGDDLPIKLSDFQGKKNVVLIFYPFDFSPVCGDEIAIFNQMLPLFEKRNAELIGISTDSIYCHQAFAEDRKVKFNLLSDFEPKGAVAKLYDVYEKEGGFCQRALFLIDKNQNISWSYLSPVDINPGADGVLEALDHIN